MGLDTEVEVREVIIITTIMATIGAAVTAARGIKEFIILGDKGLGLAGFPRAGFLF